MCSKLPKLSAPKYRRIVSFTKVIQSRALFHFVVHALRSSTSERRPRSAPTTHNQYLVSHFVKVLPSPRMQMLKIKACNRGSSEPKKRRQKRFTARLATSSIAAKTTKKAAAEPPFSGNRRGILRGIRMVVKERARGCSLVEWCRDAKEWRWERRSWNINNDRARIHERGDTFLHTQANRPPSGSGDRNRTA